MNENLSHEKPIDDGFDFLLSKLGFGRWTLFMFVIYIWWASFIPYFSLGGAFYNPTVDHWCEIEELSNVNWTHEQKMDYSIPWVAKGKTLVRSNCFMYDRNYSLVEDVQWNSEFHEAPYRQFDKIPCKKWNYDRSTFENTVSSELDLVCNNKGLSPLYQSTYFIGIMVGEPILGIFADRYGRRTLLRISTITFGTVAVISALVPYYSLILAGRFILGMLHASIGVGYVYAMEACPPKYRTISGLFLTAPFALTGVLFGSIAYFIRNWRLLQLVCSAPVLLAVAFLPFMDESPRWQILQGKSEEAKKCLKRAARWQNVYITDEDLDILIYEEQLKSKVETNTSVENACGDHDKIELKITKWLKNWLKNFFVLIRTPVLRVISLAMFVCWFATGVTYWGISLSGANYSSNPFLYIIFSSLAEIPGYMGFVPFVSRFGRKSVLSLNFAICSVSILGILFVPQDCTWAIFTLALVGKLFITGSYNILYLFSSELFPTSVRAKGLNISSMMARIGSIISPFIIKILASSYWWAPSLAFGSAAAFGSIGALLLPESKGKPLSETIEQVEIIYGKNRKPSSQSTTNYLQEKQLKEEQVSMKPV